MNTRPWWGSVLAVLAGYIIMAAALTGLLSFLPRSESFFANPLSLFSLVGAGLLAAFAGGYATAWLSPGNELPQAGLLAFFVLLISALSGPEGPLWFRIAIPLAGMVGAIGGGYWRALHTRPDIKLFHLPRTARAAEEDSRKADPRP